MDALLQQAHSRLLAEVNKVMASLLHTHDETIQVNLSRMRQ